MKTFKHFYLAAFAFVSIFSISMPAHAAFKCWTNNEGIKECGEKVPPEFAQKGHQELSSQGLVRKEKDRAKTKEELAEEERLAAIEAEKQKKVEEQARKDKILLDTFSSTDDIQMTRDGKIVAIESSITLTNKRSEKINQDLQKRRAAAEKEELNGKAPNPDLLKDIESLERQIKNNKQYIADKQKEIEDLKAAYKADMERFSKLRRGEIQVGSLE